MVRPLPARGLVGVRGVVESEDERIDVDSRDVVIDVDYLDERDFAEAAAARAKAGADIVNRTYRERYVEDPNELMEQQYLGQFNGPNETFTPADIRYVNWRFLMSNNVDAVPSVSPSIDTFVFSYRFERAR